VATLDEVDHERHAVHPVAGAQAVLQEVGVVRVTRVRELIWSQARRALADLAM